jgi:hypothetical protein
VEPNTGHVQDGSDPGQPAPAADLLARFREIGPAAWFAEGGVTLEQLRAFDAAVRAAGCDGES